MTQTMRAVDPMIQEFEQEASATRRMLERVPEDQLAWQPHPKSMTLGQLALHVAGVAGTVSGFLEMDRFDVSQADFTPAHPESKEQIMAAFEESQATTRQRLESLDDAEAGRPWKLTNGEQELFTVPKIGLARSLVLNHLYHHRGQLSVYLRMLDVPVPATYGRSADESTFA